jgi:prolyl oligopeptidase
MVVTAESKKIPHNPTLLRAYGGFGSVSSPNYDTGLLHFMEKGGVYAFAKVLSVSLKSRRYLLLTIQI